MANNRTLTTANSKLALAVRGLFVVPQVMEGYSADDSIAIASVTNSETYTGVDGKLSGGYVPQAKTMTIMFQADSLSLDFVDAILTAQDARKELFILDGVLAIQGTGKKYALTKGFVTEVDAVPSSKKTLQPRKFTIVWESVTPAPGN